MSDLEAVRDETLDRIRADAAAGRLGSERRRVWVRRDEPATEEEAERWLAMYPAEVDAAARGDWEDGVAVRCFEHDPDDLDTPHPGGSRWDRNILGEAVRDV